MGTGKRVESASKSGGIQGPPPFVPKIKSFADRTKTTTEWNWQDTPQVTTKGYNLDQFNVDIGSILSNSNIEITTSTTTTTTTTSTTTTTRRPTTPGSCGPECKLAATIKIADGYEWSNSLLDPNTFEWQDLADKIKRELGEVYRNSLLGDSFDRIEIEAFSKGSVLVDYYVFFKNFEEQVTTSDLKIVLNQQLEDPLGQTMLGRFMVDPSYTDFIVVANPDPAPAAAPEDVGGMPDWAIAVVVIGLGSFAFVLVFGITVMSNKRRRSAKKKHEVPLTEDMLNQAC